MDLWKSLQIVRQRKWIFLAATLIALGIVLVTPKTPTQEPVYVSHAKLLLTPSTATMRALGSTVAPAAAAPGVQWWLADEVSLKELIASEELLQRVVDRAELTVDWRNLASVIQLKVPEGQGQLTFFQLGVVAESPEEAQKLTNLLADEFITYVQELSAREYSATRRFLEELVAEAQQKVSEAEDALLQLQTRQVQGDASESELVATRSSLEERRSELRSQVLELEGQVASIGKYMDGQSPIPPWAVLENQDRTLAALDNALAEHQLRLVELQQVYTADSRQVKEQSEKLAQVKALYDGHLRTYVESLYQQKVASLQDQRQALLQAQKDLASLQQQRVKPEQRLELQKLERQLTVWSENQLGLVQQLYQARIAEQASRRQGALQVIQRPQSGNPSGGYVAPPLWRTIALAFPFCLFFGIAAALLNDYLSSSFQMLPRIEETLELPVVCVIPTVSADIADEWERLKRNGNGHQPVRVGGNGTNGHGTNGHGTNGHRSNGHRSNGSDH